jgi:hypothetical protein
MSGKLLAKTLIGLLIRIKNSYSGQIRRNHEIGMWITFLASLPSVNSIVEIGTWNGKGSSKAIVRGVMLKSKPKRLPVTVCGYEINPEMAKSAGKVLRRFTFFKVTWMKNAPNVYSTVPECIDLLILDGGEFSTFAEFRLLNERVTDWIILDDTNTRKCAEILKLVKDEKRFQVIYESDERHGTAVLKRLQSENDR